MIPKHVLKKVKSLEIATRRLVNNQLAGEYKTTFKGQGMTFSDFREYVSGDDVRAISWTLTARTGKPHIKKFEEERELTLMLVVDISGSENFGSRGQIKGWVAAEIACMVALSAAKNKDPVGLMMVSDSVEHMVPPKKGKGHVQRILRDLLYFQPESIRTQLSKAFVALQSYLKKRSVVLVISDFVDSGYESALKHLSKKHDVICVIVDDPLEGTWNFPGVLVETQDLETGATAVVELGGGSVRDKVHKKDREFQKKRSSTLARCGVDVLSLTTHEDVALKLVSFFSRRKKG